MKYSSKLLTTVLLTVVAVNASAFTTGELLINPGAEDGTLNGWTVGGTSNPTIDDGTFNSGYGVHSGTFSFRGGHGTDGSLTQIVSLVGNQGITGALLDSGNALATFSFFENSLNQGGTGSDAAGVSISFLDAGAGLLGSATANPFASPGANNWTEFSETVAIPAGTRSISYQMNFVLHAGSDLDSSIDDNSLIVSAREIPTNNVPDAGHTVTLFACAVASVATIRRRVSN